VFDPKGKFLFKFGKYGSGNGELSRPSGVCVDNDDNILVTDSANNRIQVFSKDGVFKCVVGGTSFDYPYGIFFNKVTNQILVDEYHGKKFQILA
jgi:DNA-binding beta-propeller fold protein YncE